MWKPGLPKIKTRLGGGGVKTNWHDFVILANELKLNTNIDEMSLVFVCYFGKVTVCPHEFLMDIFNESLQDCELTVFRSSGVFVWNLNWSS